MWFQIFKYKGGNETGNIVNPYDKRVLDVSGNKDVEGQPVGLWKKSNGIN